MRIVEPLRTKRICLGGARGRRGIAQMIVMMRRLSMSEVKSWNIKEPIYYPGGNAPEGSPSFRTRTVVDVADYQTLQSNLFKAEAELEQYKSGDLPTWKSEYENYKAVCESLDVDNQYLSSQLTKATELLGKLEQASRAYMRVQPDDVHFEDCATTVDEDKACDCGIIKAEDSLTETLQEIAKWREIK